MTNRTFIALTLSAVLALNGCATTDLNGQPSPTTGQDVARALIGIALVGGLIALAASQDNDDPEETYVTSCGGGTCRTDVYR